ncbi:tetratricopeptide repeat protein [Parapedobacter sp. ISTM3]|uniref:tetratricopeptide repeat protein n=1 Tax=Parapedobacter sp. ISTM3 TaxID=2800130 RepID=UPI00190358B0|nr:tetratricopeptide repeat protein [Parapedobacter sp. ISTM3]MBK1441142.1 tetratricopeptide repeat protein [Parapedobacter sp. ISTM3]
MMKKAMIWGISLAFVITGVRAQSLDDARKAIDAEQFAQAKGMLETLVKNKPKAGENYFYLGLVYIHNEHLDSALNVFNQGLAADPKNNLNKVGQGIVDLYNENASAAATKFAEATSGLKRRDYLELYHIGRAYIDAPQPDYQKAVEYLDQAKAKNNQDPLIPLALGDAYFGLKNNSMAYKSYRDATVLDNTLTRARVQMQVITRGSHAWQEAIDGLKQIASEVPDYAPTYRELAETYHAWANTATTSEDYAARNKEAVAFYKQYMDKTDYTVDSRIRYADFLVYVKDYEELQAQAAELAQLEDVNPKILRYLGYSAYENKQYQESKEALEKMFTRMEEERIISLDYLHLGLADINIAVEQDPVDEALFDKGIAQLEKAVAIDSSIADDLHEVGMDLVTNKKKYALAAKVFEIPATTPTSRNHVYDNFYLGFATYYGAATKQLAEEPARTEWLKKADTALGLVIEKAPTTQDAYLFRARVNNLLDDSEKPQGLAAPYFLKYIEVVKEKGDAEVQKAKNNFIEIYNNLAAIAAKNGEYQQARDYLNETLKLDPANEYAKQTLQYLEQASAASTGGSTGQ